MKLLCLLMHSWIQPYPINHNGRPYNGFSNNVYKRRCTRCQKVQISYYPEYGPYGIEHDWTDSNYYSELEDKNEKK